MKSHSQNGTVRWYWNFPLFALLILTATFRLYLLDRGALAYPDEYRYENSLTAAVYLIDGKIAESARALTSTLGRPGDASLSLIPAFAQVAAERQLGLPTASHESLLIPRVWNVAISVLQLFVFYRLTSILFPGERIAALLASTIYALLGNSNIYVRHLVPYGSSLLIFMLALYYSIRDDSGRKRWPNIIRIGALTGFAYTVYPGYYAFPAIVLGAFILSRLSGRASGWSLDRPDLVAIAGFVGAFLGIIGCFELLSNFGGRSYLGDLYTLQSTITQGSFEEGFSFALKYAAEVEGPIGLVLTLIAGALLLRSGLELVRDPVNLRRPKASAVAISCVALAGFLFHAAMSSLLHEMVFYGRILHMYVPFFVWLAVAGLVDLQQPRLQRTIMITVAIASLFSFARFVVAYQPLAYPRDVIRSEAATIHSVAPRHRHLVLESISDPHPSWGDMSRRVRSMRSAKRIHSTDSSLTLVNLGFFYPLYDGDFQSYSPAPQQTLLYRGRHWLTHPTTMFEGNTIRERRLLTDRDYHIEIYQTNGEP